MVNLYADPTFSNPTSNSTRSNRGWVVGGGEAVWAGPDSADFYLNNSNAWGESTGLTIGVEYEFKFTVTGSGVWVSWYKSDPYAIINAGQTVNGTTTITFRETWAGPQTFIAIWVGGPATLKDISITVATPSVGGAAVTSQERGWYHYTETHERVDGTGRVPLTVAALEQARANGHTIIFRYYVIEKYLDVNTIDQSYLNFIAADIVAARTAGVKLLIRFTYSTSGVMVPPYFADPPRARVVSHITQLVSTLNAGADVIDAIQAGFIGMWGEWYYTDNFGDVGTINTQQWNDRKAVVDALFSNLDSRIFVLIRYVGVMRRLLDAEPDNANYLTRMGHHNDAFLAEEHDWGTYGTFSVGYSDAQNRAWLVARQQARTFPLVGETANYNPPRSDLPSALAEMAEYRWTSLNPSYHMDVINSWGQAGYDEVAAKLGYRLTLGEVTATVNGANVSLNFTIVNDGWAAIYRNRPFLVDFVSGGTTITRTLTVDVREWGPGTTPISVSALIPSPGTWKIYFRIVDETVSLQNNPLFSVAFANDSYSSATGRIDTTQEITVTASPAGTPSFYPGTDRIETWVLNASGPLHASPYAWRIETAGVWSGWTNWSTIAGVVLTSLQPSTTYRIQHRVRTASDVIHEGDITTVSTRSLVGSGTLPVLPSVRSSIETTHSASALNVTSETVKRPPLVQQGDLLVLYTVMDAGVVSDLTVPSGFTQLGELGTGSNNPVGGVAYKVAGASEPATYTYGRFSASADGASLMVAIRDWDGVTANLRYAQQQTTLVARAVPSVTPATSNGLVLTSAHHDATAAATWGWVAPGSGLMAGNSTNAGGWSSVGVASQIYSTNSAISGLNWVGSRTTSTVSPMVTTALTIGAGSTTVTTPPPVKSGGTGGAKTDVTSIVFSSGGISYNYHRYASGLDWTKNVGLLIWTDGSAEFGLNNPTSAYLLAGTEGMIAVAKRHNMMLITPMAPGGPCADGDGVCWYDSSPSSGITPAQKLAWSHALIGDVLSQYDIDKTRIAFGGYSSGAQWTTQYWGPGHAHEHVVDGVAVAVGYGGQPKVTNNNTQTFKDNVPILWNVGIQDTAWSQPAWNDSVQKGIDAYNPTYKAYPSIIGGVTHDRYVSSPSEGEFGRIMNDAIIRHIKSSLQSTETLTGTGTLNATGTLSGTGVVSFSTSATLSAEGTLSSTVGVSASSAVTLSAVGTLSGSGSATLAFSETVVLGAVGTLSGTGIAKTTATVALSAAGALSGIGEATFANSGSATLLGDGTLSGVGSATKVSGSGLLSATGVLTSIPQMRAFGSGIFSGNGSLFGSGGIPGRIIARDEVTLSSINDVDYVNRYYLLQSSILPAPSVPATNPPTGSWSTTEPTYTPGATNSLYTTDLFVFSDGTFDYLPVQLSSSYEAAKEAWNKAEEAENAATIALTSANGRNSRISSILDATGTTNPNTGLALVKGDTWDKWDSATTRNVIASWIWSGSAWQAQQIKSEVIHNLDVTKLIASTARIQQAVIEQLVADIGYFNAIVADSVIATQIAAAIANIVEARIENLVVTEGASINDAVILKLAAQQIAAQVIRTAIDPTSKLYAMMDSAGFRIINSESGVEVIRLGKTGNSLLQVGRASVDSYGSISGTIGSFDRIYSGGRQVRAHPDDLPRGIIAWGETFGGYSPNLTTVRTQVVGLEGYLQRGRAYRLYTNSIVCETEIGGTPFLNMHYTLDGSWPGDNWDASKVAESIIGPFGGFRTLPPMHRFIDLTHLSADDPPLFIRACVSLREWEVSGWVRVAAPVVPATLAVEDLGTVFNRRGGGNYSGTGQEALRQRYVKQYAATGWANYVYGGARNTTYNAPRQGKSDAGAPNIQTLFIFPNMVPDLAGARIHGMTLYARSDIWGTDQGIGSWRRHGYTSIPTTNPTMLHMLDTPGWPRSAQRTLPVNPNDFAAWQNGSLRGFGFCTPLNELSYFGSFSPTLSDYVIEVDLEK